MTATLHLDANRPEDLKRAAELLREGHLVAFATETVYGLGANALSAEAVTDIFKAKQRPSWDPLIVHIASVAQLADIAEVPSELTGRIEALAKAFWPGPLTLLLPRSTAIPDAVTAGRSLVGVRIPAHAAALSLLAAASVPIAAPSANLFGHTSPTTAAHVLADLDGRIDAVLDAGPTSIGLESTVLDPTQTPMMLYRPGAITPEQITAATGVAVLVHQPTVVEASKPREALPAPGVGLRHYAPRARLQLVDPTPQALEIALESVRDAAQVIVLLPTDWSLNPESRIVPWARWDDHNALAATLFAVLRAADDLNPTLILCPLPAAGGLADAIRDRLFKAATPA
jgi:L-threonylcarbamoyladenylate synthase